MEAKDLVESASDTIHVVVANLTGVLGQLISGSIERESDMLLVGQVGGGLEALLAITPDTDVLLIGAPKVDPLPGICSHLLSEFPYLKILVLAETGDAAALYWLGLRREPVVEVSTATLLNAIRQAHTLNQPM